MSDARVLRPEEWPRLDGTMPPLMPYVSPENVAVIVVEEGDRIVACMTVLQVTHFEGLWIHPDKRGNAGVLRPLLRLATALAEARGEQWVFGGCADDRMRGFMSKLGAVQVPMELYALWVGQEARKECLQ